MRNPVTCLEGSVPLQGGRPKMKAEQEARRADEVPDRYARGIWQRPRRLAMARRRVREGAHEQRESRRILVRPSVAIGDFVERMTRPDRPAGAKVDLRVALPERDGFPHDPRKKQKRKNDDEPRSEPILRGRARYPVKRGNPVAHSAYAKRLSPKMRFRCPTAYRCKYLSRRFRHSVGA